MNIVVLVVAGVLRLDFDALGTGSPSADVKPRLLRHLLLLAQYQLLQMSQSDEHH